MIHPYEIVLILVNTASTWVRQYQLTQERKDLIILRVVPSTPPSPQELVHLEESMVNILGQDVEFRVALVSEIQIEQNGKFRVSRSLVKSAYDGIDWDHPYTAVPQSAGRHDDDPH